MCSYLFKFCCILFSFTVGVSAKIEYCSENNFNSSSNGNYLQFTKERISHEYAVASSFKSLHCCAKGYRSIQWFKDGKAYPWASDVSSFILYPEAANQTIYVQSPTTVDSGIYTCQITNDSSVITHTIDLNVFDSNLYSDNPLGTYDLAEHQYIQIGHPYRLFCEAFIGKNDLPDADYEITWIRPGMNSSLILKDPRIHIKEVPREDGQVVGLYFLIDNVKKSDAGEYICKVSNSIDQILYMKTILSEYDLNEQKEKYDMPWLKVIFIISIIFLLDLFIYAVFHHTVLLVLLFFKNLCWRGQRDDDGKLHDILVCYMSCDTDFIKTTLAETLNKKYGYSVNYKQLIDPFLSVAANQSKCVLLIGSPGMCNNEWTPKNIHNLLQYMMTISNDIIFLPIKPIPTGKEMKSEDGKKLEEILRKVCIVEFKGNKKSDRSLFWLKLRLLLPPKKMTFNTSPEETVPDQLPNATNQSVITKVNFLMLTKSKEGEEVLV